MAEIRIVVDGDHVDADVESLWGWLREEPILQGTVQFRTTVIPEGTMGFPVEIVIVTSTGVTVSALARSLSTWLAQRKSEITVEVTGRKTSISAKGVANPDQLLEKVQETLGEIAPRHGGSSDAPT